MLDAFSTRCWRQEDKERLQHKMLETGRQDVGREDKDASAQDVGDSRKHRWTPSAQDVGDRKTGTPSAQDVGDGKMETGRR